MRAIAINGLKSQLIWVQGKWNEDFLPKAEIFISLPWIREGMKIAAWKASLKKIPMPLPRLPHCGTGSPPEGAGLSRDGGF